MRNTSGAKRVLGTRPGWSNHTTILLLVISALGCGRKDQFIEGRVKDSCDRNWPICSQIAGCLLGTPSYIEGRLPGSTQFIVQLAEPSTVRVHVFIEDVRAVGQQTSISFFETGCRDRGRQEATGAAFVGESDPLGDLLREPDLFGLCDSLDNFTSDPDGRYTLTLAVHARRRQSGH